MAGQFSDTGSKYALEALTGYAGLRGITGTPLLATAVANNLDVAANNTTGVARTGYMLWTFTAGQLATAGILPGHTFVMTGVTGTTALNKTYTVANINTTQNQLSVIDATAIGTPTLTSSGAYFYPANRTTYLALATAQPLDNNSSTTQSFIMQEYGATGYARQPIAWSASSATNTGAATLFVGTGTINGVSTVAPIVGGGTYSVTPTTAVSTGSSGSPANQVTVTTSTAHTISAGDTVTLASWTGGTGTINGTWIVTGVPSATSFTFTAAGTSGTFTAGTVTANGPYNITYTTYNTAAGTGTPVLANHGFVVGATVNITGTTVSAGSLDNANATIVAVPSTSTFTIQSEYSGTGSNVTATTVAASASTVKSGVINSAAATGYVTYVVTNSFKAGDTVAISGITTTTAYNGTRQVYAADSTQFVVYDATTGTPAGTASISRVGAAIVGGLITGPTSGTTTFGPFTANTGQSITHAALVSQPGATSVVAAGGVAASTPAATFATFTTATDHNLRAGNTVLIQNVTPVGYNGLYTVLAAPTTTTFVISNATTGASTTSGTVEGSKAGELLAWWALDTQRTPATNDSVTIGTNQLSLYVN